MPWWPKTFPFIFDDYRRFIKFTEIEDSLCFTEELDTIKFEEVPDTIKFTKVETYG